SEPRMAVGVHQRFELCEPYNVANALIFNMHLHVEFLSQEQQSVDRLAQILGAIAVVCQVAEDAQVARTEHLRSLEGLGIDLAWSALAKLEPELVTLCSGRLPRWAPLQERCAQARYR